MPALPRLKSAPVVVCDYGTNNECIFSIPYDFLETNVLPQADLDYKGRYLFEVYKSSLRFNWRHSIDMDGRPFLVVNPPLR